MNQAKKVQRWIERINDGGNSDSIIVDTLLKLRPVSKSRSGIQEICEYNGIPCLMKLIQRPTCKILDISCSILANCLTEELTRKEVLKHKGIQNIVKVLRSIRHPGIVTRTCRSIANLSNNLECSNTIHSIGTVHLLVKLIKDPLFGSDCINSALRALKNLADTPNHRKKLIQNGCVSAIEKHLDSESKDVLSSAVRALSAISRSCTLEFADHMLGNEGEPVKKLVKIINGGVADDKLKEESLSIIINLTLQGCARPTIGNTGGLQCIVDEIKKQLAKPDHKSKTLPENSFRLVGSLCYCCREAINRAKLRSLDALSIFVDLLLDKRWKSVHSFILTTLHCFVYDEEGLKILHESGIFPVLLQSLLEFTKQEKETAKAEKEQTAQSSLAESSSGKKVIWDGHDFDEEEGFDRRHSLSYDVPTKFHKRMSVSDDGPPISGLAQYELDWRLNETESPYSPQWSPAGPSPVPGDDGSSHVVQHSSTVQRPSSETDFRTSGSPAFNLGESLDVLRIEASEPILDQDESSNSHDSFDCMNSPALLPASTTFKPILDGQSSRMKRDRKDSTSSHESTVVSTSMKTDSENQEFLNRMEKDLLHAPKRAKIENLKGDDRIRSRSWDTDVQESKLTPENIGATLKGPSSPSPDLIIPETGNNVCSPSFLQFVNETCSVPPNILKQAGRDTNCASSSASTSKCVSLWKPARRRRSSGTSKPADSASGKIGGEKVKEKVLVSTDSAGLTSPTQKPPSSSKVEEPTPLLLKTMSSPTTRPKLKPSSDPAPDVALSGPEPSTLDQVILCVLCHYCEMADTYVVSLAQQDTCTECLATYIRDYPRELYSKLHRIIDRLSSCVECFDDVILKFLLTSVTASSRTRTVSAEVSTPRDMEIHCKACKTEASSECKNLLNLMWHNFALTHSSLIGSNSVKKFLVKGNDDEICASTCALLLLAIWYYSSEERMKNVSDSILRYLISNLQIIIDRQRMVVLCSKITEKDIPPAVFQSIAYVFHVLTGTDQMGETYFKQEPTGEAFDRTDQDSKDVEIEKRKEANVDNTLLNLFKTTRDTQNKGNTSTSKVTKHECRYVQACSRSPPDKVLVFASELKERKKENQLKRRQNLRSGKCRADHRKNKCSTSADKSSAIEVHVQTLCEKSVMFDAMLRGKYRESSDRTVTIHDVPYDAAVYTIHCLYGCCMESCTKIKAMFSKIKEKPSLRYQLFCNTQKNPQSSTCCPLEISILRTLDLWLLEDERMNFMERNDRFFVENYIRKEILSSGPCCGTVAHSAKKNSLSQDKPLKETSYSDVKGTSISRLPSQNIKVSQEHRLHFLNFIVNHQFLDLQKCYIQALFCPCLFHHDYLLQGEVISNILSQISDHESFSKSFLNELNSLIVKMVSRFTYERK